MRYFTFLLWQTRLWLVGFGQRVRDREQILAIRTTWDSHTLFARFVDAISPWQPERGYKRVRLRRWLYRLRYPVTAQRFWSLTLVQAIVYRLVPRPSFGRYEAHGARYQLMAEWLDQHSEYADRTTGNTDTWIYAALFDNIEVPWSLKPETWLMTVDFQGFIDIRLHSEGYDVVSQFEDIVANEPEYLGAYL